jgi:Holliday junction resolvasome RuvABC endonuclease subunit
MRILAIDPGRHCGFAFAHTKDQITQSGAWDLGADAAARPSVLATRLRAAIAQHQPEVVAVELASMGGRFQRAAARLDELIGVVKATALGAGCTVWEWNIGTWKKLAIGNGRAEKPEIIKRLKMFYGIEAADSNEADAIGILLASQQGPPPLSEKKETKRIEKVLAKRQQVLFGGRRR